MLQLDGLKDVGPYDPNTGASSGEKSKSKAPIVAGVVVVILLIIFVVFAVWLYNRRRRNKK